MRTVDFERVLTDDGLIPADAPPLPLDVGARPWYVSVVLGGAGWLASLFMLSWVVILFQPDTAGGAAVLGAIMLGAGVALYRVDRDNAFFEQLALALSLAGQLALMYAVAEATSSAVSVAAFTTALQLAVVVWIPNHFAKMLAAFFACLGWVFVIRIGWWGENLFDQTEFAVSFVPALLGWLVIWVPIAAALHVLIEREAAWMATDRRRIARPALTGMMLGLSMGTWASEPFAAMPFGAPPVDVPVNWLTLWPLLGVAAALFAGVCAFRLRHRAMIGVSIAGALLHVVQFYYLLGVRLVVKSYIMLVLGAVLLALARSVRGRSEASEPPVSAGVPAGAPSPGGSL